MAAHALKCDGSWTTALETTSSYQARKLQTLSRTQQRDTVQVPPGEYTNTDHEVDHIQKNKEPDLTQPGNILVLARVDASRPTPILNDPWQIDVDPSTSANMDMRSLKETLRNKIHTAEILLETRMATTQNPCHLTPTKVLLHVGEVRFSVFLSVALLVICIGAFLRWYMDRVELLGPS